MTPQLHRRFRCLLPFLLACAICLGLLIGLGLAVRAYVLHRAEEELAAVKAELDASDPGWRWEDIEGGREVVPPAENSAPLVLAAGRLLPGEWPQKNALWWKT